MDLKPLDLDTLFADSRLQNIALAADGSRLIAEMATVQNDKDGKKAWIPSLWEIDLDKQCEPRRLTSSRQGEHSPMVMPDGSVLFLSGRPGASSDKGNGLWRLPKTGEAIELVHSEGGIAKVVVANNAPTIAFLASVFPDADTFEVDAEIAKKRDEEGVQALVFQKRDVVLRFWDKYEGPRVRKVFVATLHDDKLENLRCVATLRAPGGEIALTADGTTLLFTTAVEDLHRRNETEVHAVDLATNEERTLLNDPDYGYAMLWPAPRGSRVAVCRERLATPQSSYWGEIVLVDLATGDERVLVDGKEIWARQLIWSNDCTALYFTSDRQGHLPVFAFDVETGEQNILTRKGAFSCLRLSSDGKQMLAAQSSIDMPPRIIRLLPEQIEQEPEVIYDPSTIAMIPAEEHWTTAADGTNLHSWLVIPPDASPECPVPLLLFVHGGPVDSWNFWSWRWCAELYAAQGYAVLMPDPGSSLGYGYEMLQRGWGQWATTTYGDVVACLDAVLEQRPEFDSTRTAALGASFGGYMVNRLATQTDRFRCIVSHAGLYATDQFVGTTDFPVEWRQQVGFPELVERNSPHLHGSNIRTPMLVTHGELDYRVPIGESLRLWADLQQTDADATFVYFPDENHWILKPQNSRFWYKTVLEFLETHLG